ncbi:MAG: hypothetical protein H0U70_01835 [Tatlockia sp.]|nr:hypothetical protein [Tatlockia sp.]
MTALRVISCRRREILRFVLDDGEERREILRFALDDGEERREILCFALDDDEERREILCFARDDGEERREILCFARDEPLYVIPSEARDLPGIALTLDKHSSLFNLTTLSTIHPINPLFITKTG